MALCSIIKKEDKEKLKDSPFIGLIIDETTDITIQKKLSIFASTVSQSNGKTSVFFLGNFEVSNGTALSIHTKLCEVLKDHEVPLDKISGLASDGAAVMIGRHNGVGAKLRTLSPILIQVHCVAHRVSLASSQACSSIKALKDYQRTIDNIYKYYSNSAVRYNRLREIEDVLKCDAISLKAPKPIRWLSLLPAVKAIDRYKEALVTEIEQEKSSKNPIATALYRELKTYKFVYFTKLLLDVLPLLDKLCKTFQREDLELSLILPIVNGTKNSMVSMKTIPGVNIQEYLSKLQECNREDGNSVHKYKNCELKQSCGIFCEQAEAVKNQFLDNLIQNLDARFPINDLDILACFDCVLNPKKYPSSVADLATYANNQFETLLLKHESVVDVKRAKQDFLMFKHTISLSWHVVQ